MRLYIHRICSVFSAHVHPTLWPDVCVLVCKLTHPLDSHSWRCLHKGFSAASPRIGALMWALPTQWLSVVASPVPLYLRTNEHVLLWYAMSMSECHFYHVTLMVIFSREILVQAIPVHCFFTSLVGMGWTAIRYLGSASKNRRRKIKG